MDRESDVSLCTGGTQRGGLVVRQPHAAPALVLKRRQAEVCRIGGDGGGVELFDRIAVGQSGCAEARGISSYSVPPF